MNKAEWEKAAFDFKEKLLQIAEARKILDRQEQEVYVEHNKNWRAWLSSPERNAKETKP